MFLLSTSIFETMRFIPPLTVSEPEVNMALEIFEAALGDVFKK
jgi:4-aminobutyrate aminotransferase